MATYCASAFEPALTAASSSEGWHFNRVAVRPGVSGSPAMANKGAGVLAKSPQKVRPALPKDTWPNGLAPWVPELDAAAPNASPDLSMAENTSLVAKSGKAAGARLSEICWSLASPSRPLKSTSIDWSSDRRMS